MSELLDNVQIFGSGRKKVMPAKKPSDVWRDDGDASKLAAEHWRREAEIPIEQFDAQEKKSATAQPATDGERLKEKLHKACTEMGPGIGIPNAKRVVKHSITIRTQQSIENFVDLGGSKCSFHEDAKVVKLHGGVGGIALRSAKQACAVARAWPKRLVSLRQPRLC